MPFYKYRNKRKITAIYIYKRFSCYIKKVCDFKKIMKHYLKVIFYIFKILFFKVEI